MSFDVHQHQEGCFLKDCGCTGENMKTKKFIQSIMAMLALSVTVTAQAVDAEAAKALAKQNNCLKCHAIDKEKEGPTFKKVAEKYKGKADAQAKLVNHLTSGEKAKFPDGHEEEHKIVKTNPPKDVEQVKNLADWVLSQ
jgi:cytochrome c